MGGDQGESGLGGGSPLSSGCDTLVLYVHNWYVFAGVVCMCA